MTFDIAQRYQDKINSVHFIGVGGAGMSALALVLAQRGIKVTGSDLKDSPQARRLRDAGITIYVGHAKEQLGNPDVVVVSTAIPETNVELSSAREREIEVWPRAQMLAYLAGDSKTIAIAGTHGKTSTSSMLAFTLKKMGESPSFCIGGVVAGLEVNAESGEGETYVVEADESDGSFIFLSPSIAVVTNVEPDHLDHYASFKEIQDIFVEFMQRTNDGGHVIVNGDSESLVKLARASGRDIITYGSDNSCDYSYKIIGREKIGTHFAFLHKGKEIARSYVALPGAHMVLNATAVLASIATLGLNITHAAEALSAYTGVHRRFDVVGEALGVLVVDDYGHHPTEVDATLKAAADLGFNRVLVAFQPHRYSRTELFKEEFGNSFDYADKSIILDVYAAGEVPVPGVSGRTIIESILNKHPRSQVAYMPHRSEIVSYLLEILRPGDLFLTMGAGDVTTLGANLLNALKQKEEAGAV